MPRPQDALPTPEEVKARIDRAFATGGSYRYGGKLYLKKEDLPPEVYEGATPDAAPAAATAPAAPASPAREAAPGGLRKPSPPHREGE